MLNWYKVCQRNILHTITPPLAAWTVETRHDGSMLSCSLHQILTLPSECSSRNPDSSCFYNLLLSSFGEPVWIVSSVSCSYLTEWQPVWFSAAGAHLLQGSMCCVFRDVFCIPWLVIWVTVVFLSSLASPFSSDLWHQQGIVVHTTAARWIFLFFWPFAVNPRDGWAWKSQ